MNHPSFRIKSLITFIVVLISSTFLNATTLTVPISLNDQRWTSGGTAEAVGSLSIRVGAPSGNTPRTAWDAVMPFQLPSIPSGEYITSATLKANLEGWTSFAAIGDVQLFGIDRTNASSTTVYASDFVDARTSGANPNAVILQEDFIPSGAKTSTNATGQTLPQTSIDISSFIQNLYSGGATPGLFGFLTLAVDVDTIPAASSVNNYYVVSSANSTTSAWRPYLTIETAASGLEWSLANQPSDDGDRLLLTITNVASSLSGEPVIGIHYRVDTGSGFGPVKAFSSHNPGQQTITVPALTPVTVQVRAVSKSTIAAWSPSKSATPTVSAPPTTVSFGSLTAIGAGGVRTAAANGTYGQFTVTSGVIKPNTTPLTAGTYNIGGQTVQVVSNTRTVSNRTELNAAITAVSATPTNVTLVLRRGNYGYLALSNTQFVANTGTVTFTSANPQDMAQMTLMLAGQDNAGQGRLIFDHIDFFQSYDTFMAAYPNVTGPTVTSTNFAVIRIISPENVTFRHCKIRSDLLPAYDISLGAKWRVAKQAQHPNGSFLLIKATEALGNVNGLTIEDCEISNIFYGLLLQGNNIICRRNTFRDIWCDMHDLFAPSSNVLIEDTYAQDIVGDILHPDFIQIYTRGTPYQAVTNLTFRRNVSNAGPKSAFVEHTEIKPLFAPDDTRQTFQGFRVESSLSGCSNWTVEDNVFGGATSSSTFIPVEVPNSVIQRNTVAPMFRNGSNKRIATTLRVTFYGGAGSTISENVGTGTGNGVLVTVPAGVTVSGNVGGLDATSVASVQSYFVGPSFELADMISKEAVLSTYSPKPGGPLDN